MADLGSELFSVVTVKCEEEHVMLPLGVVVKLVCVLGSSDDVCLIVTYLDFYCRYMFMFKKDAQCTVNESAYWHRAVIVLK